MRIPSAASVAFSGKASMSGSLERNKKSSHSERIPAWDNRNSMRHRSATSNASGHASPHPLDTIEKGDGLVKSRDTEKKWRGGLSSHKRQSLFTKQKHIFSIVWSRVLMLLSKYKVRDMGKVVVLGTLIFLARSLTLILLAPEEPALKPGTAHFMDTTPTAHEKYSHRDLIIKSTAGVYLPAYPRKRLFIELNAPNRKPDFGGLEIRIKSGDDEDSEGNSEEENDSESEKVENQEETDEAEGKIAKNTDHSDDTDERDEEDEEEIAGYYADDDFVRSEYTSYNEDNEIDPLKSCRRTQSHRLTFPSCNNFHQLDIVEDFLAGHFRFVGHGAFRQVFTYKHHFSSSEQDNSYDRIALKEINFEDPLNYESMEYMRMDALVAERLTSSPKIYNIYGHCGLGILSEYFYHGDIYDMTIGADDGYAFPEELNDEEDVDPKNNLTPNQKLVLALEMAEGLAELHGHSDALIIHDDVQLVQWLLNKDKTALILNDFNRAEFPLWDAENNEYCRYCNGRGHGRWRAPEEYKDLPLTEKIDVFSLGNLYFSILTGLNPVWKKYKKTGEALKAKVTVKQGIRPILDQRYETRSPQEGVLVKLIKDCLAYKPAERPSIFQVVDRLKKAVKEILEDEGITRASVLQEL